MGALHVMFYYRSQSLLRIVPVAQCECLGVIFYLLCIQHLYA